MGTASGDTGVGHSLPVRERARLSDTQRIESGPAELGASPFPDKGYQPVPLPL